MSALTQSIRYVFLCLYVSEIRARHGVTRSLVNETEILEMKMFYKG